jgi:hypothetical protein
MKVWDARSAWRFVLMIKPSGAPLGTAPAAFIKLFSSGFFMPRSGAAFDENTPLNKGAARSDGARGAAGVQSALPNRSRQPLKASRRLSPRLLPPFGKGDFRRS